MVETTILRRTSAERYCARVYTNAMTPRIMIQIYMAEGLPPGRNSMARMEMKTRGVVSKRLRRRKCKERTEVAEKRTSFTKRRAVEKNRGMVSATISNQQR
jgi:hypothetical protein